MPRLAYSKLFSIDLLMFILVRVPRMGACSSLVSGLPSHRSRLLRVPSVMPNFLRMDVGLPTTPTNRDRQKSMYRRFQIMGLERRLLPMAGRTVVGAMTVRNCFYLEGDRQMMAVDIRIGAAVTHG